MTTWYRTLITIRFYFGSFFAATNSVPYKVIVNL